MVTVLINNRDLVTWPKEMLSCILKYEGLHEVIILDNASTYPPLLEWYEENPCRIIRLNENVGHTAPFQQEIVDQISTELFVVTDPDLGLQEVPSDVLLKMMSYIEMYPVNKIGLSLNYKVVPKESVYYQHVNSHEKNCWGNPRTYPGLIDAAVDTTFAIYSKSRSTGYTINGCRMDHPYMARHYPWEVVNPDPEFLYYLEHANSSCTYLNFWKRI